MVRGPAALTAQARRVSHASLAWQALNPAVEGYEACVGKPRHHLLTQRMPYGCHGGPRARGVTTIRRPRSQVDHPLCAGR
jgi:hypothetical protein